MSVPDSFTSDDMNNQCMKNITITNSALKTTASAYIADVVSVSIFTA